MNLNHLFDLSLTGRRETVGLEFGGDCLTFDEIDARANRMAQALAHRGLKTGDRLCVHLANCLEMIDLYLACTRLGVIFVPINILYRDREVAYIMRDAEPAAFVSAAELPALAGEAAAQAPDRPEVHLDGDAPAGIIYTSGTTGASKGAILTHNNFAVNAITLLTSWQITADDRLLLALPLFHVHGLGNGLHCWLASGCRMRLLERFEHQSAAATFLDFRPTLFFGVPTIYVRLLEVPEEAAREIGAGMRLFVSGSAPLPAQVLEQFRARYGHTILERYGMSENLMDLSNPYLGERRPGSVGLPLPGIRVRLVNGEIQLKGPNVFAGYWRREEATRNAFEDGWFKTGDLADVSADGYYTLRGRKSDLIISGGFNIYPREIEEFLMEQPEIAEAAVCGRPDATRGEIPVAYVVLKAPVAGADLERRCRANLASFKVPRAFHTVERLPRNAMGKVQKHLLSASAAQKMPRDWNAHYSDPANISRDPSRLLVQVTELVRPGHALDLACGPGRNALYLASLGWKVTAVDASPVAIDYLRKQNRHVEAQLADLERGEFRIEAGAYDLICDFYYLQRDLFPQIREGVRPGGIFTGAVHLYEPGRNSNFALHPGELRREFAGWKILYYSESEESGRTRRSAKIIARRA